MSAFNSYNKYTNLREMPYKIISHLLLNNEDIWKLLKYTTPNALNEPNLTIEEKASLIYNGQVDSSSYRVFMQPSTDDSFPENCAILRVYPDIIIPKDNIKGVVTFTFELLSHAKINTLNNYSTRIIWMLQQTIETLNGANIDGLGALFFNRMGSNYDGAKQNLFNNKNYFGYTLMMSTWIGDTSE
jgi:hypothetical protein